VAIPTKIAIGFRVHSGWAAMVAVAGWPSNPVIVDRRRIEIAEGSDRGPVQPFHTAQEMGAERGAVFLDECRAASVALASASLETAIKQTGGDRVQVCAILTGSGRRSPNLEATLASHAAIHSAEGEFFREVVARAAEHCGLRVDRTKEKELFSEAERKFGMSSPKLRETINEIGKIVGPPWREDQKFAALAAWLAMEGASLKGP
jgi:hypothetical protein